jgi:hypothetical protein
VVTDKLPRSPNILSRHADVIGFERGIQDDLALLAILDDVNVRLVPTLVARINDDAEPFDLYAGHVSNANLRCVGLSNLLMQTAEQQRQTCPGAESQLAANQVDHQLPRCWTWRSFQNVEGVQACANLSSRWRYQETLDFAGRF